MDLNVFFSFTRPLHGENKIKYKSDRWAQKWGQEQKEVQEGEKGGMKEYREGIDTSLPRTTISPYNNRTA